MQVNTLQNPLTQSPPRNLLATGTTRKLEPSRAQTPLLPVLSRAVQVCTSPGPATACRWTNCQDRRERRDAREIGHYPAWLVEPGSRLCFPARTPARMGSSSLWEPFSQYVQHELTTHRTINAQVQNGFHLELHRIKHVLANIAHPCAQHTSEDGKSSWREPNFELLCGEYVIVLRSERQPIKSIHNFISLELGVMCFQEICELHQSQTIVGNW